MYIICIIVSVIVTLWSVYRIRDSNPESPGVGWSLSASPNTAYHVSFCKQQTSSAKTLEEI